jgi:L-ribulose-5-phosphate 3-epimerase
MNQSSSSTLHSTANRVGVCSWSLQPASAAALADRVRVLGLTHVQLDLDPIREAVGGWGEIESINALRASGITVLSGMMRTVGEDYSTLETIRRTGGVRPDRTWGANLRIAGDTARLARRLGVPLVTFHAGFIPHERGAERRTMIDRLRAIVDHFDDAGVRVGFETGQESAATLVQALEDLNRPHAGVNFDPANMILYGMGDPVRALRDLATRVIQIHIKDARPAAAQGQWGEEMRVGDGRVDWAGFLRAVREQRLGADLVIEREAGEVGSGAQGRGSDVVSAVEMLGRHGFGPAIKSGGPWHE